MISVAVIAVAGSGQALKGDEWGIAYRLATEPLLHFATASVFGSPAFTPAQLRSEPAPLRQAADVALARALALHVTPVLTMPSTHNPGPRVLTATAAVRRSAPGCITIRSGGPSPSLQLELPSRGVALVGANQPATQLALARFGALYAVPLEPARSTRIAQLRIPPDADPMPWRLLIRGSSRPIEACGL